MATVPVEGRMQSETGVAIVQVSGIVAMTGNVIVTNGVVGRPKREITANGHHASVPIISA